MAKERTLARADLPAAGGMQSACGVHRSTVDALSSVFFKTLVAAGALQWINRCCAADKLGSCVAFEMDVILHGGSKI
jgi:hypothetical protein